MLDLQVILTQAQEAFTKAEKYDELSRELEDTRRQNNANRELADYRLGQIRELQDNLTYLRDDRVKLQDELAALGTIQAELEAKRREYNELFAEYTALDVKYDIIWNKFQKMLELADEVDREYTDLDIARDQAADKSWQPDLLPNDEATINDIAKALDDMAKDPVIVTGDIALTVAEWQEPCADPQGATDVPISPPAAPTTPTDDTPAPIVTAPSDVKEPTPNTEPQRWWRTY